MCMMQELWQESRARDENRTLRCTLKGTILFDIRRLPFDVRRSVDGDDAYGLRTYAPMPRTWWESKHSRRGQRGHWTSPSRLSKASWRRHPGILAYPVYLIGFVHLFTCPPVHLSTDLQSTADLEQLYTHRALVVKCVGNSRVRSY